MARFVREILPIEELARQDRLPGRYPTTARLGDKRRRGDNAVFFDDTQSILFRSTYVSLPTTLPVSSSYITNDLKSSITLASGSVTKASIDQFVTLRPQTEPFTPFNENRLLEQDLSSDSAFQAGTDITQVGFGFSSRMRDKTALRLELPVRNTTPLSQDLYYNFRTQTFDPVNWGPMPVQAGSTFFCDMFGWGNNSGIAPLFTCIGTQMSRNFQRLQVQSFFGITTSENFSQLWTYDSSYSLLLSGAYLATGSIPGRTFIPGQKQFIIEKAAFEIPFSTNAGWLNDKTQQFLTNDSFGPFHGIGGPAISVGLLNQISPTRRDLIMSGTIIPFGDTISSSSLQYNWGSQGIEMWRCLAGFTNWSTPAAVVSGSGAFTGSVLLKMTAAEANGLTVVDGPNTTEQPSGPGNITSFNPFGRSMLDSSGRSVFGREYNIPQNIKTPTFSANYSIPMPVLTPTTLIEQVKLANLDQNTISPYLFSENDNLVIYISAPICALTSSNSFPYGGTAVANYQNTINSGTMYLTLYGSEVADGSEFHDTLNQRLETNEVHEAVGFDPVLDQFDVPYSSELSGSLFDEFSVAKAVQYLSFGNSSRVTGSFETDRVYSNFTPTGDNNSWSTQFGWSTKRLVRELKKSSRTVNHVSQDELYADCRIPDLFRALKTCNASVSLFDDPSYFQPVRILYAGRTGSFVTFGPNAHTGGGFNDWLMSFPYESRYKDVSYTFSNLLKSELWPVNSTQAFRVTRYEQIMIEVGSGPNGRFLFAEGDGFGATSECGAGLSELVKVMYGFGDGISNDCNQFVRPRGAGSDDGFIGTNFSVTAELRGWRHGLVSAFPVNTFAVFRRNRFGQFRDMLEQRPDTKFYDLGSQKAGKQSLLSSPVSVKFVDSSGQITLPEYTYSSNLSTEATSSRPYCDGEVRNREEPLQYARLNQSITVI